MVLDVGRVCMKIAGRDSNKIAVVIKKLDDNHVLIEGNVRRKKCNVKHLEPLNKILKIKEEETGDKIRELLQKKYIELQTKEHQLQKINEQLTNILHHIGELKVVEDTLNEIKKTKEGTEVLVPLGSGIFAKANLKDNKKLNISVGSKVNVVKSLDETKDLVNKQIKNMGDLALEVEHNMHEMSKDMQNIQQELLKGMQEVDKN